MKLSLLVQAWRDRAPTPEGEYKSYLAGQASAALCCADELEAALAQQPPTDACENCQNGRDCSRWDCASVSALAQQAQPLTDEMIEAEVKRRGMGVIMRPEGYHASLHDSQ